MSFSFLNHGNSTSLMHCVERFFLPEMLYFHVLVMSSNRGAINGPEEGNEILNDWLINLS